MVDVCFCFGSSVSDVEPSLPNAKANIIAHINSISKTKTTTKYKKKNRSEYDKNVGGYIEEYAKNGDPHAMQTQSKCMCVWVNQSFGSLNISNNIIEICENIDATNDNVFQCFVYAIALNYIR